MLRFACLAGCVLLSACGGRVATPVAVTNNFDPQLSCAHLQAEYGANRRRVVDLVGEQGQSAQNNIGLLLISPLFLDFSSTIKKELRAIQARDERLAELATAKNCGALGLTGPGAVAAPATSR